MYVYSNYVLLYVLMKSRCKIHEVGVNADTCGS